MKKKLSHISYTTSFIEYQFLWFDDYSTIDDNSVHNSDTNSFHNINFIDQLFLSDGEHKDWNHIKREFQLTDNLYYKFRQI